jgi:hypothetical protein
MGLGAWARWRARRVRPSRTRSCPLALERLEGRRLLAASVLSVDSPQVIEGDDGTNFLGFTVTLEPPSVEFTVRVDYTTADGTARAGDDYEARSGTLVFLPDDFQAVVLVPIHTDRAYERDETLRLVLSNPVHAVIGEGEGVGTIRNDDPAPALSVSPQAASVSEGDPSGQAVFLVRRTSAAPSEIPATVHYTTVDGTAAAGRDFQATAGTLTFQAGEDVKTVAVPLIANTVNQPDRSFSLRLSDPVDGTIETGEATVTIADDDPAGTLRLGPDLVVREADGTATVRVFRDGGTASGVTVRFATADGTALAGSDYLPVGGTLTFDADVVEQSITIPIRRDFLIEPVEAFTLVLSDPGGGAQLGSSTVATITIMDSDALVVVNTNDGGPGSLRDAILTANAMPGQDIILFDIPGAGPHTIRPGSPLPAITDGVEVAGDTQPGFAGSPLIVLDGAEAGPTTNGLLILAGPTVVRGLEIVRFGSSAVWIQGGSGNGIFGNILGRPGQGNGQDGLTVVDSSGNQIGAPSPARTIAPGNVISGNGQYGLRLVGVGSRENRIAGNRIGTDLDGRAAQGNGAGGILLDGAPGNQIGADSANNGNIISANGGPGLQIAGASASGNLVQGNRIGTDASGTARLGNLFDGIFLDDAPGNTIGGTTAVAGNLISANGNVGLRIAGTSAAGNLVLGNRIGTNATGNGRLGNVYDGVFVHSGASNNTIGGTAPGAGNLISGNGSVGIQVFMPETHGNVILANRIGTNAAGDRAVPNGRDGVFINESPGNTIGLPGAGNLISGNGSVGLQLFGGGTSGNIVQGNRIGTNASGAPRLGNGYGLFLNAAPNNQIGGPGPARNLIAGNRFGNVIRDNGQGGPVVLARTVGLSGDQVTSLTVTFSRAMDPSRTNDVRGYRLSLAGASRGLSTRTIGITRAIYDSFQRAVVLTLDRAIPVGTRLRLTISGRPPRGLTDSANRLLDGNGDGRPGGDAILSVDTAVAHALVRTGRTGGRSVGGPLALRGR